MHFFTICNIGLGCPRMCLWSFTPKIHHISIYYNSWKCHFWGVSKKDLIWSGMALNANELHIPAPSPEEGVAIRLSACISTSINTLVEATELRAREPVFSRTYGKSNALKVRRNSEMLQSLRRTDLSSARIVESDLIWHFWSLLFGFSYSVMVNVCLFIIWVT